MRAEIWALKVNLAVRARVVIFVAMLSCGTWDLLRWGTLWDRMVAAKAVRGMCITVFREIVDVARVLWVGLVF